ncbi:MAG: hypothetical protein ABJL99_21210 [Aliishimia sp.]
MHSLYLQGNWPNLHPALAKSFPNLPSIDLSSMLVGSSTFVEELAAAHDLTTVETDEMLDDIVLHALASGLAQTSDVTHRIVASS